MTFSMRERIRLGTNPLGYHPPERVYEPQFGIAPLGFREAVCRSAGWDAGNRSMRARGARRRGTRTITTRQRGNMRG